MKALKVAPIFIVVLAYVYFIFAPFKFPIWQHIVVHQLRNLEDARNYYTIISSISTVLTGLGGIFLGYHYFTNKKVNDRANIIIEQLNKYDESVDEILNLRIESQSILNQKRQKIERNFEIIECIIDNNTSLLNYSKKELKAILDVNAYVDKSDVIMRISYEELNRVDLGSTKTEYIGKIQEARKICYLKTR